MSCLRGKLVFGALAKGQATIEYILLLVVVISLALGIGGPLGKYLKDFSGALMGPTGYYACLTKNGLLPGATYASPTCQYRGPNLQIGVGGPGEGGPGVGGPGRPGIRGPGSSDKRDSNKRGSNYGSLGGSDSGGKNKGKKSSRHKVGKKGSNSSSGSDLTGSQSSHSSSGDSSSRESAFPALPKDKNSGKKDQNKRSKTHRVGGDGDDLEGNTFKNKKGSGKKGKTRIRISRGDAYLGDRLYMLEEEEKKPVFEAKSQGQKAKKGGESEQKKGGLVADRKPTKETKLKEEKAGFSFGGFLKYLVIAVMIIAIVIVIFSQIMEYQSRD